MGNHDFAVFYEPFNFNSGAEPACYWTRKQFRERPRPRPPGQSLEVSRQPAGADQDATSSSPSTPRRAGRSTNTFSPTTSTPTPASSSASSSGSSGSASSATRTCPGVFLEGPDFYSPDELDYQFELTDEKAIINVGSVGQPRDRDPRSSFVVVTDTAIEFVRVPYDVRDDGQEGRRDRRTGRLPGHPAYSTGGRYS